MTAACASANGRTIIASSPERKSSIFASSSTARIAGASSLLTTASILAAFRKGTHPNFLSHPYTCNGQALKGASAICNDNYLMNQIENGVLTQPSSTDWTTSKGYFPGIGG